MNQQILDAVVKFLVSFFSKEGPSVEVQIPIDPQPSTPVQEKPVLDWTDPASQVSKYFTMKECLWLHQWNRMGNQVDGLTDQVKANILSLCQIMDQVRELIGHPMNVHCIYRPGPYSVLVGGSATDVHTSGMAIDFDCGAFTCDQVKALLMPKLEKLGLRMEDNGTGAGWVHLDIHPVVHARFFKA